MAGCGFSPLYAHSRNDASTSTADWMARVAVLPIEERIGQKMRLFLEKRLSPGGAPRHPRYSLKVQLNSTEHKTGLRDDETATRATLTYTAHYELKRKEESLIKDSSRAASSYNILKAPYATRASEENARERAARLLANDIALRLAAYFKDFSTP